MNLILLPYYDYRKIAFTLQLGTLDIGNVVPHKLKTGIRTIKTASLFTLPVF